MLGFLKGTQFKQLTVCANSFVPGCGSAVHFARLSGRIQKAQLEVAYFHRAYDWANSCEGDYVPVCTASVLCTIVTRTIVRDDAE